jgi:hypothetical protein
MVGQLNSDQRPSDYEQSLIRTSFRQYMSYQ